MSAIEYSFITHQPLTKTTEPMKTMVFTTLTRPVGKNVQLVHSLAPALGLALSLTLNHLANKPQQTTSTLVYWQHNGHLTSARHIAYEYL